MSFIQNQKRKKEFGISLTELMVTITMIVILATTTFISYKSSQKQLALQRAVNRLAQDVRKAENMAGAENAGCVETTGYKYGYGLNFKSGNNFYEIFADCNGDNAYDSGNDIIIEQITFESGIICQTTGRTVFILPDPIVSNNGVLGDNLSVVLAVENSSPLQSKTITINSIGAVDF